MGECTNYRDICLRHLLGVQPLLLQIERSQLRWFSHVPKMHYERPVKQVLLAKQRNSDPEFVQGPGRVTTNDFSWSGLGVEPADLSESAFDHQVFRDLCLLPREPP